MALNRWPCVPETFAALLPPELPFFLQAGANHALGRAVSLIDPHQQNRIDAFSHFDSFQPFCFCLRQGCLGRPSQSRLDAFCNQFDQIVAKDLTERIETARATYGQVLRYRCYMGLEEVASVITVGGTRFMLVSGQFLPPEGDNDIRIVLACIGKKSPLTEAISEPMRQSIKDFLVPESLWIDAKLSEEDRSHLSLHISELTALDADYVDRFSRESKRIEDIAQNYHELIKARLESSITSRISKAVSQILLGDKDTTWNQVSRVLHLLWSELSLQYAAYLSSDSELSDTKLILRCEVKQSGEISTTDRKLHFNWRKAGLKTGDGRDKHEQQLEWAQLSVDWTTALKKGMKGSDRAYDDCAAIIPAALPQGPFGALILGPHRDGVDLATPDRFLLQLCRDVCVRLLAVQLSMRLKDERADWEKTSKLTGHRVRASMQNINSKLRIVEDARKNNPRFSAGEHEIAERDLKPAFQELEEISYAAESSVRGMLDVRSAKRSLYAIADLIDAAVEAQEELAEENGVEIIASESLRGLPLVWVNPTLMRIALINLINNGIKYSYPRPNERKRTLKIHPPTDHTDFAMVEVEFVNFGLGIRSENKKRIFDWFVRISEGSPTFKNTYGKGIGLWEVKHIVDGHGGKVLVESKHNSGAAVDDQNINQCVTVFTVCLPYGR